MLEGHKLAEQLAVEERARALRELRREFEGEQANREEVLGQVRRAEDLWGQVLTEEGVQKVVGALTQTVSSEENSIPMDRSGKKMLYNFTCTILVILRVFQARGQAAQGASRQAGGDGFGPGSPSCHS